MDSKTPDNVPMEPVQLISSASSATKENAHASSSDRAFPRAMLALALALSLALLGWFSWHVFDTYRTLQEVRQIAAQGEELRDRVVDLGHEIMIAVHQIAASGTTELLPTYEKWSRELDEAIDAAARLEHQWFQDDFSSAISDSRRGLDTALAEAVLMVTSGHREDALRWLDTHNCDTAHATFEEAADRFVVNFRARLESFLEAERNKHLTAVAFASLVFAICVGVWFALVQWLKRNREALIAEMAQRQQVEARAHELEKNEFLGRIASGIAHDFNNVTTAIAGLASLARGDLANPQSTARYLDQIADAARQAGGITGSLLRFTRRSSSPKGRLHLGELASRTLPLLRSTLPANVDLSLDAPRDAASWVEANEAELQQVIMNLFVNARDAVGNQEHAIIRIRVRESRSTSGEPGMELVVEDNGHGMTQEVREHIFDPFFTTKARGQGTGLGIPVVHKILTEHTGTIQYDSAPGQGTRARVWLPAVDAPLVPIQTPDAEDTTQPPCGHPSLVLLAEDHPLVNEVLQNSLRTDGFRVMSFRDGESLLAANTRHKDEVRCLIVDYDLPGRNGLDCLEEIRCGGQSTPAILITGVPDKTMEDRVSSIALLLRKPFTLPDLSRLVCALISPLPRGAER